MKKKLLSMLFILIMSFAFAKVESPVLMLKNLSDNLISELSKNKDKISSDEHLVVSIIDKILVPKVDKLTMSKAVVGPVYWSKASQSQRDDFVNQFTIMVTDNYARLFAVYTNQKVTFRPFRSDYENMKKVEISSSVTSGNKQSFNVNYKLTRDNGNSWLISDFSIDGISMVGSYKSQFAPVLSAKGLVGLIDDMRKHNIGS